MLAAVVAALGAILVFVYVQGADDRAAQKFETVDVLRATVQIERGESIQDALANGKIAKQAVPADQRLPTALLDISGLKDSVALTTIYPGEQIIPERFGAPATASAETDLQIPEGQLAISINLTDTARVAGFVNPGSEVALILNGTTPLGQQFTRVLLPRVTVIAVGSTTPISTTTTDASGESTTEQLPKTLMTLGVDTEQALRVKFAESSGELSFALLTDKSSIKAGRGITAANLFKGK